MMCILSFLSERLVLKGRVVKKYFPPDDWGKRKVQENMDRICGEGSRGTEGMRREAKDRKAWRIVVLKTRALIEATV